MTDVDTLDADLTAPDAVIRWHVGHNDWGYSPSNPPSCHEDVADARDALAAEVAALAEYIGQMCDHPVSLETCEDCRNWDAARHVAHMLSGDYAMGEGVRFELSDGRPLPVVYWAWPVTLDHAKECNHE